MTLVSTEEFFGVRAGRVWETLKANGPLTAAKICDLAELEEHEVRSGLGWLAREGKIRIEKGAKNYTYALTEN